MTEVSLSSRAPVESPLAAGQPAEMLAAYPVTLFIERWQAEFDIDIRAEFAGADEVIFCQCPRSRLRFFTPASLAGGDRFYEALSRFPWYYDPEKWEHGVAERHIGSSDRVLEVGCGFGAFVGRLQGKGIRAEGIELNSNAVARAQSEGLEVSSVDVRELAERSAGRYSAVVAFQVLEHIAAPLPFLEACVRLLAPGGLLLVSVPNGGSWLANLAPPEFLLDSPPHHMGRWSPAAFMFLPTILPLTLESLVHEPLQPYHYSFYAHAVLGGRGANPTVAERTARRLLCRGIAAYLRKFGRPRNLPGHTILAQFRRNPA